MNITPDHIVVIYNSIAKGKPTFSIQPSLYETLFTGLDPHRILYNEKMKVSVIILDKEKALKYLSSRFNIQNKDSICLSTLKML